MSGVRHPIVAILLLISFFTAISGKPIDGMLMLLVAAGLARDGGAESAQDASAPVPGPAAGRPPATSLTAPALTQAGLTDQGLAPTRLTGAELTSTGGAASGLTDQGLAPTRLTDSGLPPTDPTDAGLISTGLADGGTTGAVRQAGRQLAGRATTVRRRPAIVAAWMACGALYAVVIGSFSRYSWPATVAVIGLGTAVVLVGWQGPVRDRPVPGPLPRRGTALWGGLLVAGGSWELSALLQQPNLAVDSYAHPTISSLTDPLLGSHPGRSLALAIWLGLGWLVVRR